MRDYLKNNDISIKDGTDVNGIMRMHTSYGDMDVAITRDRNGDYEPQLIKKYQNTITQDMEEKILSMYAKGMTTGDIESHMRELYDIDISDSTISRITDKILPIVKKWQERPLEEVYAVENESVKFWLSIMNGLKNRGIEDILIAYVDGLNGFPQAIEAVYPKTEIQQCIIHQIRNSTKFVSYKDIKKLMADLKLLLTGSNNLLNLALICHNPHFQSILP